MKYLEKFAKAVTRKVVYGVYAEGPLRGFNKHDTRAGSCGARDRECPCKGGVYARYFGCSFYLIEFIFIWFNLIFFILFCFILHLIKSYFILLFYFVYFILFY